MTERRIVRFLIALGIVTTLLFGSKVFKAMNEFGDKMEQRVIIEP